MYSALEARLSDYRARGYYRQRQARFSAQGAQLLYQQNAFNFCSNDYLGLAAHPEVVAALQMGAKRYGVGSGASQLITGYCGAHQELEQAFAEFFGYERALLFGSGMLANLGVITAICNKQHTIFADKLNHASLIDAVRLSAATGRRYPHLNLSHLAKQLTISKGSHPLIVSDGVFSMNGAIAPVAELSRLAQSHQAVLMIDDAHGVGVLGQHGRGVLEHFGLSATDIPILVCPLGKAFGGYGAIVLSNATVIESLLQFARSYIYTTALPPALAVAMLKSLTLLKEDTWRREKLQQLIYQFQEGAAVRGLPILTSGTPIQALVLGSAERASRVSEYLWDNGMAVTAIRPPTVPRQTSRLRITLSAVHEPADIAKLLDHLAVAYATIH